MLVCDACVQVKRVFKVKFNYDLVVKPANDSIDS